MWLQAPDYWLSRLLFERALGVIYVIAFLVAANQFRPLLGENGLLPVPRFLRVARFSNHPSIFYLHYSDRFLSACAWSGVALGALIVLGLPELAPPWVSILVLFALWALYLSIVNVGQTFYAFGWESLLVETGFLAILLGNGRMAPPTLLIWLLRWLLFRLEFGAGLIKIRGDRCWRNFTCLYYHHETQPMPNPLSWYFHHLPRPLHKVEVLGNHFAQLVVPFVIFAPQPFAGIAGLIMLLTQGWLVLSGNFSWLNAITMLLTLSCFDDGMIRTVLPIGTPHLAAPPGWWQASVIALTIVVALLSYWPIRNLLSRRQLMNYTFNPIHIVNAYGAFGSITKERYEVVIEGARDERGGPGAWKEYEFKGKPGDTRSRPTQVAPYHLRLDWLMWFAAMSTPTSHPWFVPLIVKLLTNDAPTLR